MKLTKELLDLNEATQLDEGHFSGTQNQLIRFDNFMGQLEKHMTSIGNTLRPGGPFESMIKDMDSDEALVKAAYKHWGKLHDDLADLEMYTHIQFQKEDKDD